MVLHCKNRLKYSPKTESLSRVLLGFGFCICRTQTFPPNILPGRTAGLLRGGRWSCILAPPGLFQKSLLVSLLQELLILQQFLLQSFLPSIKFPAKRGKVFPVLLQTGKTGPGLVIIRRVVDQPYLGENFLLSRFLESLGSFPDN